MWPTDMSGNYGTGIDPSLLQILLPYLGGLDLKDQKSVLDVQQKQQSNVQDLLRILFDPQFAMLTGTYDPNVITQQQQAQQQASPMPTPKLTSAANSGDPRVSFVAQGILSGEIADRFVAQKMLTEAINDPTSAVAGMTPEMVAAEIEDWFSEKANSEIQTFKANNKIVDGSSTSGGGGEVAEDPYSKAGLPQPTEQYTMQREADGSVFTNSPIEAGTRAQLDRTQQSWQRDAEALKSYIARNPGYRTPTERTRTQMDMPALERGMAELKAKQPMPTTEGAPPAVVPKSAEEARAIARNMGVDEDQAEEWYREAERRALYNLYPRGASKEEQRKLNDAYDADPSKYIGKEWETVLRRKTGKTGNPLLDRGKQPALDVAKALSNGTAPVDKTAMEWTGRGLVEAKRQAATSQGASSQGDALFRAARKSERANNVAFAQGVGQTAALNSKGRSPLTDALQQRLAMYRAVGLL